MRSFLAAATLASLLPALVGCGGAVYQPRPSPRLQFVTSSNGLALAKNGRTIALGVLGGDLDEAVQGNPRAEEEARSYQSKAIAGFVIGLGGSIAAGVGTGVIVGNEVSANPKTDLRVIGLSVAAGSIVLALVGSLLTASAQKHIWNAVNIYNDELPPPWGFGAPRGQAMPGYPAHPAPGYAPPGYAPPSYAPRAYPAPAAPLPSAYPGSPLSTPPVPAPAPPAPPPPSVPAPAPPP